MDDNKQLAVEQAGAQPVKKGGRRQRAMELMFEPVFDTHLNMALDYEATVRILDPKDVIIRKFKRAVTDSGCEICRGEGKEGVSNLMTIYSAFTGKTDEEITREFEGKGYGDFKLAVGEACADALAPVQAEFNRLMADKGYLEDIMYMGAEEAGRNAFRTMSKVRRKIGFTELKRR